jgi:hypothetical protein
MPVETPPPGSSGMTTCPTGHPVDIGDIFCRGCGARIAGVAGARVPSTHRWSIRPHPSPSLRPWLRKIGFWVVALLGVAISIAVLAAALAPSPGNHYQPVGGVLAGAGLLISVWLGWYAHCVPLTKIVDPPKVWGYVRWCPNGHAIAARKSVCPVCGAPHFLNSDTPGPGWWQAPDGNWFGLDTPPHFPNGTLAAWQAPDGSWYPPIQPHRLPPLQGAGAPPG